MNPYVVRICAGLAARTGLGSLCAIVKIYRINSVKTVAR